MNEEPKNTADMLHVYYGDISMKSILNTFLKNFGYC